MVAAPSLLAVLPGLAAAAEAKRKAAAAARRKDAADAEAMQKALEEFARRMAATAAAKAKLISVAKDGTVHEPASGAFDVTVPPGANVQAAVDACPAGGSVLLLPGKYDGPLVLQAGKEVHVFGRGRAKLRAAKGTVVTSESATSTLDGLIIRREGGSRYNVHDCVWIKGGRLRMQACDVTSSGLNSSCVRIEGGADPVLALCKCVCERALSFFASHLRGYR